MRRLFEVLDWMPWPVRARLLSASGIAIGKNSCIEPGFRCHHLVSLTVGPETYINVNFLIDGEADVSIGSGVRIGPRVTMLTGDHEITENPRCRSTSLVRHYDCSIGDGAWIGGVVTILPRVSIAHGCVIGAGSLVTKSTEPNTLYLGAPAKPVKTLPVA
ncbi:maltose O-acetyltransferase [Bradyrhizobium sp. LM2.7]